MPDRPVRPSGRQFTLQHGDHEAVVVEVGGALRRYRLGGWEVLDGYGEDEMCSGARGQPLVPWPNRLRDGTYEFAGSRLQLPLSEPEKHNAIHGLVRWANWQGRADGDARVVMEHLLHPQAGYPFALALEIEYVLDDGGLRVTTTATNVGSAACPYGAGVHPYVSVGSPVIDEDVLTAPGTRLMTTDDQAIPIGEEAVDDTPYDFRSPRRIGDTQLDTGYAGLERDADGRGRVRLSAADGRREVDLWFDEGYAFLMLFTGDSLPDAARRRRGLGVEPMTCAPNAFQSGQGLRVLEPGERARTTWGISPSAR